MTTTEQQQLIDARMAELEPELTALIAELIPTIHDDYRCSDDPDDDTPGMLLTIGADMTGWGYQTGDNSFSGGAYGYASWGIGYLYRDSDPADVARDIITDLYDNGAFEPSPFSADA